MDLCKYVCLSGQCLCGGSVSQIYSLINFSPSLSVLPCT